MPKWFNNDTVALLFIGTVAIIGVVLQDATVSATAIGAIGGYIGAKTIA